MSLLNQIRDAGIIGAGGAGFPTHVKLNTKADYIIMNGAECEPLLRVDQQLLESYPDEILRGFEMVARLVEAKDAVIGIKGKHREVIALLQKRIAELGFSDYIRVGILPDMYPAGDEQVLVYELTGRIVPETGIPIDVGCVVCNVETVLNIYKASCGKPVTEKYITLAGDIPDRMTVRVPIGTSIIDVLKLSGIENFESYAVIDGGPMMGPILTDMKGCITKKNKGFIILRRDHPLIRKKSCSIDNARRVNRAVCEQCRMCTDLCPRFLLGHNMQPHKLMRIANYMMDDHSGEAMSLLCCQCNLCEYYSCPAGLHPRLNNLAFRTKVNARGERYQSENRQYEVRAAREFRKIPSKRLTARLGLTEFDQQAPLNDRLMKTDRVRIMLGQCVGAPCEPIVSVGETVTAGQMIGRIQEGKLGAPIHASIDGKVVNITEEYIEIGGE
ncbi:4Fe-4S dicluster domain-containing protein [Hornefia butyriciproducens]|uniref:4Fe-4S dicluster domain-containing protein n=1 Tax=Hornefia butyriciproducens TaxID=2652293 RepID=UPI002A74BD6A|nr:4Fe-4S dicluster domain-containing protein [Hornefia butyriciproducens]MCI7327786.1 4Fe-4S dicluster domain-containing protein [Clostridiales bacterium]MDY2991265.1 4Fe-4S dicluster domain-containing protein [Hornefia butyriciproducens]MDY6211432.1 4Fe-4S dicluster domain-containing protein [Hornefia butyriciproducens]